MPRSPLHSLHFANAPFRSLWVTAPRIKEVIFTLRDITGKVQMEVFVAKGSKYKNIPLQQLDRGIYIYTCSTNKEIIAQGKLTIQ